MARECREAPSTVLSRGVDPYGTGGTGPPNIWTGGTLSRMPPHISRVISAAFSMQYFLDQLKEFLVFLVFSRLVKGVVETL